MKPETASYLTKAREDLSDAQTILAAGLPKVAARSAYYAMFHLAEAYIFERSEKVAKTHTGVRAEIARLSRDQPTLKTPSRRRHGSSNSSKHFSLKAVTRQNVCDEHPGLTCQP